MRSEIFKKWSILGMMALVLLLSFNLFAQTATQRAQTLKAEGDTYLDKEDYKTALEKYLKAAQTDENYAPTYWSMGLALARMHEHKLAAQSFLIFLEKADDIPGIFVVYQIGDQYRLAKEFELSQKAFDVALGATPKYLRDYEAMADIYSYRGNLSKAVEYQIKAINFSSSDNDSGRYVGLSWYYSFLQQNQLAVEAATKAIQLDGQEAMGYTNRCRAYNDLKLYDKAIADCKKALTLRPNHGETLYYMANSYRLKGNTAEATRLNKLAIPSMRRELEAAAKLDLITLHDYCYLLGNGLFADGQFNEAVEAYEVGLEFRPNFPFLRYNLGMAYLKVRNKEGAMVQYRELLKIDTAKANSLKQRIDSTR